MNRTLEPLLALALLLGLSGCSDGKVASSSPHSPETSATASTSTSPDSGSPGVIANNEAGQLVQVRGLDEDAYAIVASSQSRYRRGVAVSGVVRLTSGMCIGVTHKQREPNGLPVQEVVIVWPPGTTFTIESGEIVVTSEGRRVKVGDSFEGSSSSSVDLRSLGNLLPPQCDSSRLQPINLGS